MNHWDSWDSPFFVSGPLLPKSTRRNPWIIGPICGIWVMLTPAGYLSVTVKVRVSEVVMLALSTRASITTPSPASPQRGRAHSNIIRMIPLSFIVI